MPLGRDAVPGSMGRPLPGIDAWVDDGELVLDPATVPTFFRGYLGDSAPSGPVANRRPRHPGRRGLPLLRGPHRRRDHLRRLPHRPVRGRVGARRAPRGRRGGRRRGAPTTSAARSSGRSSCCATATPRPTRSPASCRTTSRRRPRPTSTRASSTSPTELPKTAERQGPPRGAALIRRWRRGRRGRTAAGAAARGSRGSRPVLEAAAARSWTTTLLASFDSKMWCSGSTRCTIAKQPAQAGHVDPVVRIPRRVDVGPTDRRAERHLVLRERSGCSAGRTRGGGRSRRSARA